MLVFNGYFCSYAQRQLVAYHINYKKIYIDNIELHFSNYVEKKIGKFWWNSRIICILKH